MTRITQGGEDPATTAARKAAWQADASNRIPENTPTRLDDVVRALLDNGILTPAQIAAAKRNRP